MAISIAPSDTGAQIRIDGEFNIYIAAESRDTLLAALQEHPNFVLDIAAIEEIDTSGIQLLLMIQREAKRLNKTLSISEPSPSVLEVITLLNLDELKHGASVETAA